jgi:hypothetical protein
VFDKMLGKFGSMAVGPKCVLVFIKPYCRAPASLTHVCFLTVGTHEFVYPLIVYTCLLSDVCALVYYQYCC